MTNDELTAKVAREQERAAIVAWLRLVASNYGRGGCKAMLVNSADAIERGDHLKDSTP